MNQIELQGPRQTQVVGYGCPPRGCEAGQETMPKGNPLPLLHPPETSTNQDLQGWCEDLPSEQPLPLLPDPDLQCLGHPVGVSTWVTLDSEQPRPCAWSQWDSSPESPPTPAQGAAVTGGQTGAAPQLGGLEGGIDPGAHITTGQGSSCSGIKEHAQAPRQRELHGTRRAQRRQQKAGGH